MKKNKVENIDDGKADPFIKRNALEQLKDENEDLLRRAKAIEELKKKHTFEKFSEEDKPERKYDYVKPNTIELRGFDKYFPTEKHKLYDAEVQRYNIEMAKLKETKQIRTYEMLSDMRFVNDKKFLATGFWWGIKEMFDKRMFALCIIHMPDNTDIYRRFPMVEPYVLDINGKFHLFSPSAFRYANGIPILTFYANSIFAVIHIVTDDYHMSTIDTSSFQKVMLSKHVKDAATVDEDASFNWAIIILIVINSILLLGILFLLFSTHGTDAKVDALTKIVNTLIPKK